MTVSEIWEQVKILSPEERAELVRLLLAELRGTADAEKTHDIMEFAGIAAHLADEEDPQVYVSRLRDEWDSRS